MKHLLLAMIKIYSLSTFFILQFFFNRFKKSKIGIGNIAQPFLNFTLITEHNLTSNYRTLSIRTVPSKNLQESQRGACPQKSKIGFLAQVRVINTKFKTNGDFTRQISKGLLLSNSFLYLLLLWLHVHKFHPVQ